MSKNGESWWHRGETESFFFLFNYLMVSGLFMVFASLLSCLKVCWIKNRSSLDKCLHACSTLPLYSSRRPEQTQGIRSLESSKNIFCATFSDVSLTKKILRHLFTQSLKDILSTGATWQGVTFHTTMSTNRLASIIAVSATSQDKTTSLESPGASQFQPRHDIPVPWPCPH